jgi:integrase
MNLHFNLDHPNKKRSTIILTYHYQGNRFRYSLGIQCETTKWDKNREISVKHAGSNLIYSKIMRMRAVFQEMINHFEQTQKRHPSWSEMKEYLNVHYKGNHAEVKPENPIKTRCMLDYIDELLKKWSATGRIQPSSIKAYRRTCNTIERFLKKPLSPEKFITDGPAIFVDEMRKENLSESYIKKALGNYIGFASKACEDANVIEIETHSIKASQYGLKDYPSDAIYLKYEHLAKLENIDLRQHPLLDIIRDLFMFAVYTGMRYSDLNNPKKWKFNKTNAGINYLIYTSQKTTTITKVPLNPKALDLLTKYSYEMPTIDDQLFNRKIKEIARLAGLTDKVTKTNKRYKNETTVTMFMYERISLHTARRTFCSLLSGDGMQDRTIMAFSGHKSINAFNRYILQSKDDYIQDSSNFKFFN